MKCVNWRVEISISYKLIKFSNFIMSIVYEEIESQKGKKFNVTSPVLTELGRGMGLTL